MALRAVGSKTEGSAWPVPHSVSVKVLGPKWRKRAISESCHWSCCEVGRGKNGIGGGFGEEWEGWNWERIRERVKMGIWEMGCLDLGRLVMGL